jgi:hypothetical protein
VEFAVDLGIVYVGESRPFFVTNNRRIPVKNTLAEVQPRLVRLRYTIIFSSALCSQSRA